MNAIIDMKNISKTYNSSASPVKALDKVSLEILEGEFVAIVGKSGSGKSTLMNIIGCLDTADSGQYYLLDKAVATMDEKALAKVRRKHIGFVFQKFNLIPNLTALENVALPLVYQGVKKEKRDFLCKKALDDVGLLERAGHLPNELSGGQQQRVAVARAIVCAPPIILADEPTGNLDSESSAQIMGLLKDLNSRNRTIVLITHDEKTASYADRKIVVSDGKIKI